MFRHEGPARDVRLNARIAAYLAAIAGFVNSGGFVLVAELTSHVTGSVGRASVTISAGQPRAALAAALLVVAFFVGAFVASLLIEGTTTSTAGAYGVSLMVQALLLTSFVALRWWLPAARDVQAAILSAAMGMQNSLVTRLSGAVVRTTHLTGIVTDLGIEAARWYRWARARSGLSLLLPGRLPPERPRPQTSWLLVTILLAFSLGALLGAVLTLHVGPWAMALPPLATFGAALHAFSQRDPSEGPPR